MSKTGVRTLEISPEQGGRRLDNYLSSILKNVPKSFIYRIIRRGEVRVNGSRSRPNTKLACKDLIRIPPVAEGDTSDPVISRSIQALVSASIVFENSAILVLNKPPGIAVHSGSGLHYGAIDIVRKLRPEHPAIELAHRLDRDTSGCLVFAKNYPALRRVQTEMANPDSQKTYLALLDGEFSKKPRLIDLNLSATRIGGEKKTIVASDGKHAATEFTLVEHVAGMSLTEARISTGRTHQIRVHAVAAGHPVAGDKKYGDVALNMRLRNRGLRRMFLHAKSITLRPDEAQAPITIEAPIPNDLGNFLSTLRCTR